MKNEEDTASSTVKKPWTKPQIRRIVAGSAENGSNTTTNGDAPSGGAKS